jgi:hypothetical protein
VKPPWRGSRNADLREQVPRRLDSLNRKELKEAYMRLPTMSRNTDGGGPGADKKEFHQPIGEYIMMKLERRRS